MYSAVPILALPSTILSRHHQKIKYLCFKELWYFLYTPIQRADNSQPSLSINKEIPFTKPVMFENFQWPLRTLEFQHISDKILQKTWHCIVTISTYEWWNCIITLALYHCNSNNFRTDTVHVESFKNSNNLCVSQNIDIISLQFRHL